METEEKERCPWPLFDEKETLYHDTEWGRPLFDDRKQFEFLSMEVFQCGLSWDTILQRREVLRVAFDDFDPKKVASYTEEDVKRILSIPRMIKAERKIRAVINNASCFLKIQEERGSFSDYLWDYSDHKVILYEGHEKGMMPSSNGLSTKISQDLKKRGFKFLGPVVIYSHLQACGIINDHLETCFCYKEICDNYPTVKKKDGGRRSNL